MALSTMNVRRTRALIWVGTVGVSLFAGWKALGIYESYDRGEFDARDKRHYAAILQTGQDNDRGSDKAPVRNIGDFAAIWSVDANGFVPKKEVVKDEVEDDRPKYNIKPITDVVKITQYIVDGEGGGVVFVQYEDDIPVVEYSEQVLGIGDRLKYPYDGDPFFATVKEIRPDGVIFSWGGEDQMLRPDMAGKGSLLADASEEKEGPATLSAKERDILKKHRGSDDTVRLRELESPGTEAFLVGSNDLALFASEDNRWKSEVRVAEQPSPRGSGREVVIVNVRETGRRYGVSEGDVLVSINGTPVTSKQQAVSYVRTNGDLPRYDVVLMRRGKEITKVIYPSSDN